MSVTVEQRLKWAEQMAAVDEVLEGVKEPKYVDRLLQMVPNTIAFEAARAAITNYDFHSAHEKLSVIGSMAYSMWERESACEIRDRLEEIYDEIGLELNEDSMAAHAALYAGRLDLWCVITH
jgi:hypothetical protein